MTESITVHVRRGVKPTLDEETIDEWCQLYPEHTRAEVEAHLQQHLEAQLAEWYKRIGYHDD